MIPNYFKDTAALPSVLFLFLIYPIALVIIVNVIRLVKGKNLKVTNFPFSLTSYYLFNLTFLIPFILLFFFYQDITILFLLFAGFMGIIGEIIFSYFWDSLFAKKFWEYKTHTILNGYSSWLNIIPWGFGGILFVWIYIFTEFSFDNPLLANGIQIPALLMFWLICGLLWALLFLSRLFAKNRNSHSLEFKSLNLISYGMFALPTLIPIIFLTLFYSLNYLILSLLFGIIGFVCEYIYGKLCLLFTSNKLWTYTYHTFDHNHATFLAIIPFTLAGWYFYTLYEIFLWYLSWL